MILWFENKLTFIVSLLISIGFIWWWSSRFDYACDDLVTIDEIGGCNMHYCGVKFSDGTFGEEGKPVLGKPICRHWEKVEKK